MDVITPVATCPHCGLALDARPAAAAPTASPEPLVPAPPAAEAPAFEDAAVWSDPWALGTTAEAPAMPFEEPPVPQVPDDVAPVDPEPGLAPAPAPEPALASPSPVADFDTVFSTAFAVDEPQYAPQPEPVAEFTPLVTHIEPAIGIAEEPEVVEDPWIAVPPPGRQPAPDAELAARVIDTGRGWGIRDGGPDQGTAAAAAPAPLPQPAPVHRAARPAALPQATPGARTRNTRLAITGVAVAVLIAVTYAGFAGGAFGSLLRTPHIATPAAIGTLTRVTNATSQALLANIQSQVRATSTTQAVAAVYGTGSTPKLVFVAFSGAATQTPDQLVAAVNASKTPFTQAPKVTAVGGQPYVCGRVGTTAAPSVLCTWTDDRAAGFVDAINSTDLANTLALAAAARTSSEG